MAYTLTEFGLPPGTIVQDPAPTVGASGSVTVPFTAATAGNLLLLIAGEGNVSPLSASAGWTQLGTQVSSGSVSEAVFYKVAAGGETTVTVTNLSGVGAIVGQLYEVGQYVGIDTFATATAAAATSLATGGVTPSTGNSLIIASMATDGLAAAYSNTWTNGFTQDQVSGHYETAHLGTTLQTPINTTEAWAAARNAVSFSIVIKLSSAFIQAPAGVLSAICKGPDGAPWFLSEGGGNPNIQPYLRRFDTSTHTFSAFPVGAAGQGMGGIDAGPDGNLWVGNSTAKTLYKISTAGVVLGSQDLSASISGIAGVRAGPDGRIYVADNTGTGKLLAINTDFTGTTVYTPPSGGGCHGLNICPDGNGNTVLCFVQPNNNKFTLMTTAGAFTEIAVTGVGKLFYDATGEDGNMYLTDSTAGFIVKVTMPGHVVTKQLVPAGSTANLGGIWSSGIGVMFFTEEAAGANNIGYFTTGNITAISEELVPTAGALPDKLAPAQDGNLYVTEHTALKLLRIGLAPGRIVYPTKVTIGAKKQSVAITARTQRATIGT